MPNYQYQCESCKHSFEQYQSITASALTSCPDCEKETLQKIISGGAGYFLRDSGIFPDSKPNTKKIKDEKEDKKEPHSHGHTCHHH